MKRAINSNAMIMSCLHLGTYKFILVFILCLTIGSSSLFAQKSNVSKANAKFLSETPDFNAAKDFILPALKDSITGVQAKTWFLAGEIFYAIYNDEQQKERDVAGSKKGNRLLMSECLVNALNAYIKADSLDRLPDKKGKVKPKYSNKIYDKVLSIKIPLIDAASHFYNNKEYAKALNFFELFLMYPEISFLKEAGLERDTLRTDIMYYAGLSASLDSLPVIADKYFEVIKDSLDQNDMEAVYARLSQDYIKRKDTANMIRIFQLGAQKFPQESFYTKNLINYYINQEDMTVAMNWVNKAIQQDPTSAALWNVKGRLLENDSLFTEALECYNKAIELDHTFTDPYLNIGRYYYNNCVEELSRVNSIKSDKEYRKAKDALKVKFKEALPYFEKAYNLNPKDRTSIMALRNIYYNINDEAKYEEMDALLK